MSQGWPLLLQEDGSGPGVVGRRGKIFIDKRTMLLVRHLLVGGGVAAFDAFKRESIRYSLVQLLTYPPRNREKT